MSESDNDHGSIRQRAQFLLLSCVAGSPRQSQMGRSLRQKRRSSTWSWSTRRSGWWTSTSRSWWCCPERSTSTNGWPATVSDRAALPTSTGRRPEPVSAAAQPSTFPEKRLSAGPGRRSDAFALLRSALELFFQAGMCLSVRRAPDICHWSLY